MPARLILAVAVAIATGGVSVPPLVAAPSAAAAVSPTPPPRSAPGRLAFSTATYEADANQAGMGVHGLGTIGLDGSDQRTLSDPPAAGYDHSPQWSPDGDWLAYQQARGDSQTGSVEAVAVIPRDGGDPQIVDPHGWGPAWSPDGRRLAWVSVSDHNTYGIGIADVVTTESTITIANRRTLTMPDPALQLGWPTFSPDGQSLAFAIGDYFRNRAVLHTISTSGGNLRQISHGLALEVGNNNYAFSPDGSKLLFLAQSADRPGAPHTFVVNADGTDQHRIGPENPYTDAAAWTPTGDAIAMVTSAPYLGIRLVGVDGQYLGSLAEDEFSSWGGLTFSPDGSRIYSVASPGEPGQPSPWAPDLYAIPVNGDEPQRLTTDHGVFPTTVQAIDPGRVLRQFGDNAVATSSAAVTDSVRVADTIVVSPVDDYAATLTAAPLAAQLGAPALVNPSSSLSRHVVQAARRLHASRVVLVGALSSNVADALRQAGLTVSRVADTTSPYRAGAAVASRLARRNAYVVPVIADQRGGWQLPLATAGLAAFKRRPLLYTKHSSVPPATRRAIRRLGIRSVTVVGDDNDVTPRLLHKLSHLGVTVHRVRSSSRYAISAKFAQRARDAGARSNHPIVASGAGWASSVTAPALAALLGQVTVLVDSRSLADSMPTATWIRDHRRAIRTATLIGGVHVIRPRVEAQLEHRT